MQCTQNKTHAPTQNLGHISLDNVAKQQQHKQLTQLCFYLGCVPLN